MNLIYIARKIQFIKLKKEINFMTPFSFNLVILNLKKSILNFEVLQGNNIWTSIGFFS